ncbi:MAG: cation diffusion facilitator family transporter [Alicyclobacillus herbarius]|nr:cation diffusion facilitator family transporter [Alicyclobacillus herbarius]
MKAAFWWTVIILAVEIAGGIASHSLALLSDAGHVLTDLGAIALTWYALAQARKPANEAMTFGYHRAGILAAMINGVTLLGIALVILWEAYGRLLHPHPVNSVYMFASALVGLAVNLYLGLGFGRPASLNLRAAVLHMLGDAAASAGVIVGGLIILWTGWFWIDPALSVLIATGGALGFWWLAMMLTEHGLPFLSAWLTGRLGLEPSGESAGSWGGGSAVGLAGWLNRSAFLGGWWVVGVILAVRLARSRGTSSDGEFARWLLVWNGVAALIRCGLVYAPASDPSMVRLWETFAVLPAMWLAAYGLDRTLRREVSWRWVLVALSLLVGQVGWLVSERLSFGVMLAAAFAALVLVSAPVITGLRRTSLGWNEVEIRRWVIAATVTTFFGHAALGWQVTQPKTNGSAWHRLQQRLRTVEDVSLASLIVADRRDSPQLRYLLRSLWPKAVYSQASGWDP